MNQPGTSEDPRIPGYEFGTAKAAISPVSLDELRQLEQTIGWTKEDAKLLEGHVDLFQRKAERMVDSWRAVIGAQPHLAQSFLAPDGKPDDDYKARVKRRFVEWVLDVARRPHDQNWLDYQEEIGLRHTPAKKNVTDGKDTPSLVPLRYVLGFIPVVLPVREFFREAIRDEAELDALERAWTKTLLLHVALWTRAYTREGLW